MLLGKSDAELAGWRDALREALEPNGRLMIDVVPELKLLIGEQPPVQELPPQQAQGRLQLVFWRFLGVFARPEHPLALFLDDLQWLDAATLDMLADLLTQADVQRLLVIGAYRDNEVDSTHPLMRRLDAIRKAGAMVQEISLAPLAREDLGRLMADTLNCAPTVASPLAGLVHDKTGGNPFFAIQFISALAEEGLLRFDHDAARWRWELDRLHAKGYTDNVIDLMVGRLTRLPVETQAGLQQLACLGNVAKTTMLSVVVGKSEDDARSDLWEATRLGLVEHLEGSYKFVHDRVQEAAYSLIPEQLRAEVCFGEGAIGDRQGGPIIAAKSIQRAGGVTMTPMGVIFRSAFTPGQQVTIRSRGEVGSSTLRRPEILPPEEVMVAIVRVVEENYGAERDQLAQAVCRLFGFGATSAQLRDVVESALTSLLDSGRLRLDGRLVTRAQEAPMGAVG